MGNIEIFDNAAKSYDSMERIQETEVVANEIRKHLADAKDKEAIDFGCGTGLVGMQLLHDFKSILFIDASKEMIEHVQRKIEAGNITNAEVLCYDFESSPLLSLQADIIFLSQVLLHISDTKQILTCLYHMLREEGQLMIVDFDKNPNVESDLVHNGFEQEELIFLVKEIGFTEAKAHTFYQGSKIFMKQDASLFCLHVIK